VVEPVTRSVVYGVLETQGRELYVGVGEQKPLSPRAHCPKVESVILPQPALRRIVYPEDLQPVPVCPSQRLEDFLRSICGPVVDDDDLELPG
jgi:hypothetical protein